MEKTSFGRLFGLLLLIGLATSSVNGVTKAQDASAVTVQARELFQSGVDHYEAGEFTQALADFERAYALKPHPLVQVNIANCYDKLNQPAEALTHFDAFLASSEGSPEQRDEVRAATARLAQSAGRLSIHASPAGAQGVIDQKRTAQPVQWVATGRHRIDVTAEGYEPAVRVVDVQPGQTASVDVVLTPQPTASAPNAEPPAPKADVEVTQPAAVAAAAEAEAHADELPERSSAALQTPPPLPQAGLPANVWISGGATFGLGVVAIVTGQLALAANREFDTNLAALRNSGLTEYQRAGAWARGIDAADRADALAAVTDILLAFTFVGVGLTTYFYLADRQASDRQRVRVGLRTDAKSGRLNLSANF